MNLSTYLRGFILVIVFCLVYSITPTTAQNYYPADIGNEWVMESTDGEEERTYTLETPNDPADQEYTLLKIETEDFVNEEIDIDRYFVTTDDEGIKLHKTVFTIQPYAAQLGDIVANFSPPVIFFRNVLSEGDKWKIEADAMIATIELESITNLEVVGFEDVETPAGTFPSCAKVELEVSTTGQIGIRPTTSYQWLAPDVGPIKYQNSDGVVYELVSYNIKTDTPEPENTEDTETMEQEPEITEEEENQETVTVYDDMTYEQPPMTETETEEETEETMDDTEMTTETEEDETEEDKETKNPYDITGDGVVNILDLVRMVSHFGEENAEVDVTGDGVVNILDLVAIAQNFSI